MKKFLSALLIGAFVFGLGAADIQVANASPFSKANYAQRKPDPQKNNSGEQTQARPYTGKTQKFR